MRQPSRRAGAARGSSANAGPRPPSVVMGPQMAGREHAADPYRDLEVIDSRAPRFNQATIGLLAGLASTTGWWWLLGLLALQLAVGLTFGRRFCLPCLAYFELVQPRFGEGRLEDSRPPRFANMVGVGFLGGAAVAWWVGAVTVGTVLGSIVAALAMLAWAADFC